MSDYFNCPRRGTAPRPNDPQTKDEGVVQKAIAPMAVALQPIQPQLPWRRHPQVFFFAI